MKLPLVIQVTLLYRSHGEIKGWPVVSCEYIVSAAICIYYIKNAMLYTVHTHTHTHTHTHIYTHIYTCTHTHTHIHTHTHTHTRTRIHTYVHTHTRTHARTQVHSHTRAYSAGKCTIASTNMHSKQALSPLHEICRFLWTLKAKKLFVWASSSELWVHHLCRRFQSEIVCAKAFPHYRHLPNLPNFSVPFVQTIFSEIASAKAFPHYRHFSNFSVCDSQHSPTSASLLSLFSGNDVTAFTTAAIEDDAGTKTASNGALSDRILRKWLARRWSGHLCHV